MTIHKLVFKHSNGDAVDYIGHHEGEIFYNDEDRIIRITDGVTEGGIIIGYGSGTDIPQYDSGNDSYQLQLKDHGTHIFGYDMDVHITDNNDLLPIGYTVAVVSDGDPIWVHNQDTANIDVWGAGFNATAEYWAIPAHSMGTLIKIGDTTWMFSGAGLYDDS